MKTQKFKSPMLMAIFLGPGFVKVNENSTIAKLVIVLNIIFREGDSKGELIYISWANNMIDIFLSLDWAIFLLTM